MKMYVCREKKKKSRRRLDCHSMKERIYRFLLLLFDSGRGTPKPE